MGLKRKKIIHSDHEYILALRLANEQSTSTTTYTSYTLFKAVLKLRGGETSYKNGQKRKRKS